MRRKAHPRTQAERADPFTVEVEDIGTAGLQRAVPLGEAWLADALAPDPVYSAAAAGSAELRLSRVDAAVHLQGAVQAPLQAACVRCLTPMPWPVRVALQATLLPAAELEAEAEAAAESPPEGADVLGYADGVLQLEQLVRDELLLSLPVRPLCRGDCAGLCEACGHNKNEGPCGCAPPVDLRWQALRQVRLD